MRVWKSATKGDGNEVLVDLTEKEWDLSNPTERDEFRQIKQNLWIEGMGQNSSQWLEVKYEKQVGGQWQVVGSDWVDYKFISADDGDQPKTETVFGVDDPTTSGPDYIPHNQRNLFESLFPGLIRCEWSITDNQIISTLQLIMTYNCIAWSVDETGPNWYAQISTIPGTNVVGIDQAFGNINGIFEPSDMDAFYLSEVLQSSTYPSDHGTVRAVLIWSTDQC
jgi:hypothetical protein